MPLYNQSLMVGTFPLQFPRITLRGIQENVMKGFRTPTQTNIAHKAELPKARLMVFFGEAAYGYPGCRATLSE